MPQLFGYSQDQLWKRGPQDWYQSIGMEMQVTWGLLPRFIMELPELRFMRGQTIWLEGTLDDLRERRNAALGMARSMILQITIRFLKQCVNLFRAVWLPFFDDH